VIAESVDDVAVMYAGRIVERAPTPTIFNAPEHPYTWGLLGSIARLDRPKPRRLTAIPGLPPSLVNLPAGCAFGPRCTYRFPACGQTPSLTDKLGHGHLDACHLDPQAKKDARASATPPELIEDST
jgi:peptide/nickel transport system ATP-binding protein/oligopeptide transport system ATP-binding protein